MAKIKYLFLFPLLLSAEMVRGAAAHPLPFCAEKLTQIAYFGIEFSFNIPCWPIAETEMPLFWEESMLFLNEFCQKGDIFQKWLEVSPIRPSKIVLVQTRIKNQFHRGE